MTRTDERLRQLEEDLAAQGADRLRLEIVRRARIFKRSWVEMAEVLTQVKRSQVYLEWGYEDFQRYCAEELLLTKATVDKLTGSYAVVAEHAPQVLDRDGVAQPLPSVDSVSYLAKALRQQERSEEAEDTLPPDPEALEGLKRAVFDEDQSVAVLRRNFHPLVFRKVEGTETREALEKLGRAGARLEQLILKVQELDEDIDGGTAEAALAALVRLREEVEGRLVELREDHTQKAG
ncbi:MAG: hypothetical protein AAGH15_00425 [Myxococcota bacterium]